MAAVAVATDCLLVGLSREEAILLIDTARVSSLPNNLGEQRRAEVVVAAVTTDCLLVLFGCHGRRPSS